MNLKLALACTTLVIASPVALVACGSDDKSSSSTSSTASKDAVCRARDDLQRSIADLADPSLLTGESSELDAAVNKVQDSFDTLEAAARTEYKPEIDAVKTSFEELKAAVAAVGDGKLSDDLQRVGDAIGTFTDSASALYDALQKRCG